MTTERQKMLADYLGYCAESDMDYRKAGVAVKALCHFLEHAESVNVRGYLRYRKVNADLMAKIPHFADAINDFLNYHGKGFSARKPKRKAKILKSLDEVSESCREDINGFIEWLRGQKDYSQSSLRQYSDGMKKFFKYATEFNSETCRRFIATLEHEGAAPSTIGIRVNTLCRYGEYKRKPVILKRPKRPTQLHTENVPTETDYKRLLDYLKGLPDKDHYFSIRILAGCGARLSEFLRIQWEDVIAGRLVLKGKGGKYRQFFFSKSLQTEVAGYVKETGRSGYILRNAYTGEQLSPRGFGERLRHWADKAKIDRSKMHAHAFRHFFAKMYLKKTNDVIQLADLLGHESVDTTRLYLRKNSDEQMKDFNKNVTW